MKHNPLVPAAFVLAAGILSGWYAGGPAGFLLFLVFLGPGAGLFFFLPAGKRFYWFLLLFFFLAGVARGAGERRENDRFSEYTRAFAGKTVTVLGRVADLPAPWRGGCRFPLDLEAVDGEEAPAGLRWEVFLAGSEPALDAGALGKRLLIRGRVFGERDWSCSRRASPGDPGEDRRRANGWRRRVPLTTRHLGRRNWRAPRPDRKTAGLGDGDAAARRRLLVVGRGLPPQVAALLHGMLLGVHEGLPAATAGDFRRAGVAHLLSVSGLHLLFWLSLFWGLGKLLGLSERWLAVFSLPLVLVFLLLAGAGAPALRAGVMSLAAIFGRRWRQPVRSENLLALAACVILLLRPLDLFSRGFAFLCRLRRPAFSPPRLGRGFCRSVQGEI